LATGLGFVWGVCCAARRAGTLRYLDWLLGLWAGVVDEGQLLRFGVDQHHGDGGHAQGLRDLVPAKITSSMRAPRRLTGGLLAEDPADGVAQIRLAAAVGADDGRDAAPVKPSSVRSQKDLKPWSSTFR
jgi:hypothetical protein